MDRPRHSHPPPWDLRHAVLHCKGTLRLQVDPSQLLAMGRPKRTTVGPHREGGRREHSSQTALKAPCCWLRRWEKGPWARPGSPYGLWEERGPADTAVSVQ